MYPFKKHQVVRFKFDVDFHISPELFYIEEVQEDGTLLLESFSGTYEVDNPVLPQEVELVEGIQVPNVRWLRHFKSKENKE